jgi:SHS2 domain-containing protein
VTRFVELEHTADIRLRIFGSTMEELFGNAAHGLMYLLWEDAVAPPRQVSHTHSATPDDREVQLRNWLADLLLQVELDAMRFTDFEVAFGDDGTLVATAHGAPADPACALADIKAVTYHDLRIVTVDGTYQVDIVFDI